MTTADYVALTAAAGTTVAQVAHIEITTTQIVTGLAGMALTAIAFLFKRVIDDYDKDRQKLDALHRSVEEIKLEVAVLKATATKGVQNASR